jgi:phospholipid/cholesterol/gamma-HCH transport system permease protein
MSTAVIDLGTTDTGGLRVSLGGDWLLAGELPAVDPILDSLRRSPRPEQLEFDLSGLEGWDTGLLTTLVQIYKSAEANGVPVEDRGLPEGVQRLLRLAFAVRERKDAARHQVKESFLTKLGNSTLDFWESILELVSFLGELVLAFGRLFKGKARYQKADLWLQVQEAGAEALPIVSLISFLIGMIFAFVGVMQLEIFGAGIYTANLVAVAMIREMAPIMTAIIMAGRTGASYAAHLGTMKVNEEIDALVTLGLRPMDFLVLPRVMALIVMMPLLTMYASLLGILGGMAVGLAMLDVSLVQYLEQTKDSVGLNSLFGGLFKALVYGSLVAIAGCQQGMACGGSAMAVGQATTKAVVTGIVLIIVSASILTVIYINMGI